MERMYKTHRFFLNLRSSAPLFESTRTLKLNYLHTFQVLKFKFQSHSQTCFNLQVLFIKTIYDTVNFMSYPSTNMFSMGNTQSGTIEWFFRQLETEISWKSLLKASFSYPSFILAWYAYFASI